MHYLVEKTFERRGITPEFLENIENYYHSIPDNMDSMCHSLRDAYLKHRHIVLIPDFDMDGVCSGVCGYSGFCELGFYFSLYLPDVSKGYGFGPDDIIKIKQKWPDVEIIMTCDVGITCYDGINYAKAIGLDVLITDHHLGSMNNGADVVVDPSATASTYSNVFGHSSICGVHVIWQILYEYASTYGTEEQRNNIERLMVLVGIGTVTDIMPVICENRKAIKHSIKILKWLMPTDDVVEKYSSFDEYVKTPLSGYHSLGKSEQYNTLFYGIQSMLWYFKTERHYDSHKIDEDFFGYLLGPMFTSIKRMGADIDLAFGVFFDKQNTYDNIKKLDELNDERKKLVADELLALKELPQPYAPFIYLTDASAGLLGLLAAKLMDVSGLPTMVFNRTALDDGRLHGSGRSIDCYDFEDAMKRFVADMNIKDIVMKGHAHAFGISTTDNAGVLSSFYMWLLADTADIAAEITDQDPLALADFVVGSTPDCDVDFDIFTLDDYFHEINKYRPFGKGFFKPCIGIRATKDDMKSFPWFIMGRNSQHAKFCHEEGLDVIIWNGAGDTYFCKDGFSALGHLQYTEFGGESQLSFIIDSFVEVSNA